MEKSSVTFTEYFKSRGYKRFLNKELYNFRNFYGILQNCLEITTKLSRLVFKQFCIISEKFRKLYNSLFRDSFYSRLSNYFFRIRDYY